ncbi:MAG: rhodanese-like domain-containing protein [Ilumatobacteraceae bacterium]
MGIQQVTIGELKGILPGGAVLIDVREPDEYGAGHIPKAVNIPLSTLQDSIESFRDEYDVYLVCQSGNRSMRACEYLHDCDIVNVVNVAGGTMAWVTAGGVLTQGDQP